MHLNEDFDCHLKVFENYNLDYFYKKSFAIQSFAIHITGIWNLCCLLSKFVPFLLLYICKVSIIYLGDIICAFVDTFLVMFLIPLHVACNVFVDKDECTSSQLCSGITHSVCKNYEGGYECQCETGYKPALNTFGQLSACTGNTT